jgi:hypothetical protein
VKDLTYLDAGSDERISSRFDAGNDQVRPLN